MSVFNPGGYIDPFPVVSTGAETAASRAQTRAMDVELRLERLLLSCEAMWSLLRDKLGVSDEELLNRINDLDLSDGQLDGKTRKPAVACPKCGRTIARRNPTCILRPTDHARSVCVKIGCSIVREAEGGGRIASPLRSHRIVKMILIPV